MILTYDIDISQLGTFFVAAQSVAETSAWKWKLLDGPFQRPIQDRTLYITNFGGYEVHDLAAPSDTKSIKGPCQEQFTSPLHLKNPFSELSWLHISQCSATDHGGHRNSRQAGSLN